MEAKNSQLKNPHGLARNKTPDLKGMTLQSVMAIVAVNLKRIIALRKEKNRIRAMKKGDWIGRRFFSILASAGSFFITELHSFHPTPLGVG
ncbi:hypothetical protein [Exiguobacterium sp. ZOR0005]|uniref:hypothetical protein n=1 Tax=Exiguobacterium sp. ZOR0005 TaxID=1339226 RepID=UPI0009DF059F